jgi:hypothetical protein
LGAAAGRTGQIRCAAAPTLAEVGYVLSNPAIPFAVVSRRLTVLEAEGLAEAGPARDPTSAMPFAYSVGGLPVTVRRE